MREVKDYTHLAPLKAALWSFHLSQKKDQETKFFAKGDAKAIGHMMKKSFYTRGILPYLVDCLPTAKETRNAARDALLFQLYDDFLDTADDARNGNLTTFSSYILSAPDSRSSLIHPVELLTKSLLHVLAPQKSQGLL